MKNVIILTNGLAGSSVLTALLSKAGYWVGDTTMQKHDYNTWENAELVGLNIKILEDAGFTDNWTMEFRPDFTQRVHEGAQKLDPTPFRHFANKCAQHSPWIWKDPRLWLTIRYWKEFLDLDNVCFLVIHRDDLQSWISTTLRRQIQTLDYSKRYSDGIQKSIIDFLEQAQAPYVDILYEDLLVTPEKVIEKINQLTGTQLTVDDLKSVFRGKLYRRQHGLKNLLKASAIYLKNYSQRYR